MRWARMCSVKFESYHAVLVEGFKVEYVLVFEEQRLIIERTIKMLGTQFNLKFVNRSGTLRYCGMNTIQFKYYTFTFYSDDKLHAVHGYPISSSPRCKQPQSPNKIKCSSSDSVNSLMNCLLLCDSIEYCFANLCSSSLMISSLGSLIKNLG